MTRIFSPELLEHDDEITSRCWLADGLFDFFELLCGVCGGGYFMHADDGSIFDEWHDCFRVRPVEHVG